MTGANRVALGNRQVRGIRADVREPMAHEEVADTREKEVAMWWENGGHHCKAMQ